MLAPTDSDIMLTIAGRPRNPVAPVTGSQSMTTNTTDPRTVEFPSGTTRTRHHRVVVGAAAILAGTMLAAPMPIASHDLGVASASAAACPAVQVVFARGTGEEPGVGRVGDAFAEALRTYIGDQTLATYAVEYPASLDLLRAVDGANDTSSFIQEMSASCPDTKIVLGGYSQGAAVIGIVAVAERPVLGFTNPLPPTAADHVAAVAVFGNPSNRLRAPLTTLSPLYGDKTIDLCNGGDPVCSDGNENSAHSQYVQAGLADQAARFVANRL